jgi:hypothetical protein
MTAYGSGPMLKAVCPECRRIISGGDECRSYPSHLPFIWAVFTVTLRTQT